jgi:hypothetical protein
MTRLAGVTGLLEGQTEQRREQREPRLRRQVAEAVGGACLVFGLAFSLLTISSCSSHHADLLYSSKSQLSDLVITPDAFYVRETNMGLPSIVLRIPKGGGSSVQVAEIKEISTGPITDDTNFYWADYNDNLYLKSIQPGGNIRTLLESKPKSQSPVPGYTLLTPDQFRRLLEGKDPGALIMEMQVDAKRLYWTIGSSASEDWLLMAIPKQGGIPQILARDKFLSNVAMDSENIFWGTAAREVRGLAKVGSGGPGTLSSGSIVNTNLAVDNSYLYFVSDHTLVKLPKHGGRVIVLDTDGRAKELQEPGAVAVDDANVYWAVSGRSEPGNIKKDGMILKVPKNGGKHTQLASSQGRISHLVVDSTKLYWITCSSPLAECQLMSVAKE